MYKCNRSGSGIFFLIIIILLIVLGASAQSKKHKSEKQDEGATLSPILWQNVDITSQDTFFGPGGSDMQPDLSNITFVEEKKGGHSKKYVIKDGQGHKWVAKIGDEAQPETVAVRMLSSIGYFSEPNYLVPSLTIPGYGTFSNVRLSARPEDIKRGDNWTWGKTPFEDTNEMQGLKIMMSFMNNWDLRTINNVILTKNGQREYVVHDLGATFGKTGSSSLPLLWRIGHSRNKPDDYAKAKFIRGVKNGRLSLVFNGSYRGQMKHLTVANARWLADRLTQLSDKQIRDMFRAANYSEHDIDLLTTTVKNRIGELDRAGANARLASTK